MHSLAIFVLSIILLFSFSFQTSPLPIRLRSPPKFQNGVLYEVSTRPWLYQLSMKYRKQIYLSTIPDDEFIQLKQMGFSIIWMMGVWKLGTYGPIARDTDAEKRNFYGKDLPSYQWEDIIGSPYAIAQYSTNPEIAVNQEDPNQDLVALKAQLNRLGLSLMLDFVVNHMACDCPEAKTNPDLFVRAPRDMAKPYDPTLYLPNGIANGGPGWIDTIQINFWSEAAIRFQIENLKTVCNYADSVRVDVAFFALTDFFTANWKKNVESWGYSRPNQEFWTRAFNELAALGLKQRIMFMGEVYGGDLEQQLQNLGFDYTYHKIVMDNLISVSTDQKMSLIQLQDFVRSLSSNQIQREFLNHTAHFIENHDEIRAIASFKGDIKKSEVAAIFTMTLPGLKFFNLGQLEGKENRLIVQLRRSETEDPKPQVYDFYSKKLIPIVGQIPAFSKGSWELMQIKKVDMGDLNALFAWKWKLGTEKYLVVINMSKEYSTGWIVLPDATAPTDEIIVTDILNDQTYTRSVNTIRTQGLIVGIDAHWSQIFKY